MTLLPPGVKVHLAFGYIDMRKGIDGLSMLVQGVLRQDPFSGHLFVFRGRINRENISRNREFCGLNRESKSDGRQYAGPATRRRSGPV